MFRKGFLLAKTASTNLIRHSGHGGIPGENLPFKIGSPVGMTVRFILFFGIGTTAPWLIVRYQIWKKHQ